MRSGPPGRSGGTTVDPADRVTFDESINMAFLVVLESMTPAERLAFIPHDVFRYSFAEVAEIVGRTPAACRQLASSASRRIRASQASRDSDSPAGPTSSGTSRRHGKPRTSTPEQVAHLAVDVGGSEPNLTILERAVNGQPGLVVQQDGVTVAVIAFDVVGERIKHIWAVRNPEKLRPWTTG